MIGAMAEGARVLGEPRYLGAAAAARPSSASATLRASDGRLLRYLATRQGAPRRPTSRTTRSSPRRCSTCTRRAARVRLPATRRAALAERIMADFAAEAGGFFNTAAGHEALIVRHREGHDGAIPGANAVAAHVLARLAVPPRPRRLPAAPPGRRSRPGGRPHAAAAGLCPEPAGGGLPAGRTGRAGVRRRAGRPGAAALQRAVGRPLSPTASSATTIRPRARPHLPLLANKTLVGGASALYVCRHFACRQPVTSSDDVPAALA